MPNHTGRLVLAPRDPGCGPDRPRLILALASAGFLGPALGPGDDAYAVGEHFLHLVTFAGCAVRLEIEPGAGSDRPFCHVRIAGPYPEPLPLIGRNTRPPRCPTCRAPLRDWRDALAGPTAAGRTAALPCPACETLSPARAWDWKESGGFARLWLGVEEVFPGEAAPTDALMQILAEAALTPWRHFYLQD